MNILETIISRNYENKFGEFFITLKIKPEDITLEEREACRSACREGTLMKGWMEKSDSELNDVPFMIISNKEVAELKSDCCNAPKDQYCSCNSLDMAACSKCKKSCKLIEKEKKPETIYQRFKRVCIDYSGQGYYDRLKEHLGVKHLRDLEEKNSESMVEDILSCQINYINKIIMSGKYKEIQFDKPLYVNSLTHKDNAYNLWLELFDDFNNPKNEKEKN